MVKNLTNGMTRDMAGGFSACGFPDKHSSVCLHTGPSSVAIVDAAVEGSGLHDLENSSKADSHHW